MPLQALCGAARVASKVRRTPRVDGADGCDAARVDGCDVDTNDAGDGIASDGIASSDSARGDLIAGCDGARSAVGSDVPGRADGARSVVGSAVPARFGGIDTTGFFAGVVAAVPFAGVPPFAFVAVTDFSFAAVDASAATAATTPFAGVFRSSGLVGAVEARDHAGSEAETVWSVDTRASPEPSAPTLHTAGSPLAFGWKVCVNAIVPPGPHDGASSWP
jgi:hypothetical protein